MMSLLSFFGGSRTLGVGASSAAEVMNLCRVGGFVYHHPRFCGEHFCFDVSLRLSGKLMRACRERGISVIVLEERGLPSFLRKYRHRYGLAVGALCFLGILFFSGRVLWSVRVDGNRRLSDAQVVEALRECGCAVGVPLSKMDTEVVENLVLIRSDEISWISVNLIGTVAHVELREVEALPSDEPEYAAANLVAARGGKIELLENIRGNVAVKPGDVVSEGELLVGGIFDIAGGGVRYCCASGQVFARTEHLFSVEIPLRYEKKRYTGRQKTEKSLIFFEKEIKFFGNSRNLPATCDTIDTVEYITLWEDCSLPVGVRTVRYREYEMVEEVRSAEDARELAYAQLSEQMAAETGSLVRKESNGELTESAYRLYCRAEYIEDIAILKEIEIDGAS